jgi:amino acid transporter
MVAGWDGLLPKWFTRLHPRYLTPVNSILFVGALTLAFTLAGQIGVGLQEAFQILENAGGIFYAFAYIVMFSIPLFAARRLSEPPKLWLQGAAVAGLATSILYSVLSIFPIIDVADWRVFTAKVRDGARGDKRRRTRNLFRESIESASRVSDGFANLVAPQAPSLRRRHLPRVVSRARGMRRSRTASGDGRVRRNSLERSEQSSCPVMKMVGGSWWSLSIDKCARSCR